MTFDVRGRGEPAQEMPAPGWRDVARRVRGKVMADDVSMVAGSVAFYAFLAIFPALAALVSIYGLVADPAAVWRHADAVAVLLPPQAQAVFHDELTQLATASSRTLSVSGVFSLLFALWSANQGTKAIIVALNAAFRQQESRGFFALTGVSFLFTIGALLLAGIAVTAVVALPAVLGLVGLSTLGTLLVRWLRWPLLAAAVLVGLSVAYRYGPARASARWRWVTPGSLLATGLWLGGSALFSWYVSNFGKYDKLYGSVGVIVILLTWFLLSAYALVLGAELNGALEGQTTAESTTRAAKPAGPHGPFAADTVGSML
jgi:membrane protein